MQTWFSLAAASAAHSVSAVQTPDFAVSSSVQHPARPVAAVDRVMNLHLNDNNTHTQTYTSPVYSATV